MNKKHVKCFSVLAAIVAALVLCIGCGNNEKNTDDAEVYEELSEGDVPPDFTAELADGGSFVLSEMSDRVILINFWATWCPPCVGEMPAFQQLYDEYGDSLALVVIDCAEDRETVDKFIADNGYTFPIAYDENGEIGEKYPTQGIPYTVIVAPDGKISKIYLGANSAEKQYKEYKSAIDEVMK
ncbi:MAG: TlpA family protein disulfide reductase [Lachnospiraceae bacterium]|nr:TlpA family protein disulfide reductase [Lachnospiraceae bacterium]